MDAPAAEPAFKLGLSSYAYYWAAQTPPGSVAPAMDAWGLLDRVVQLQLSAVQICDNVDWASRPKRDCSRRWAYSVS